MNDKKLTDSEIREILEEFSQCGIVEYNIASVDFIKSILDLINRLQVENEILRSVVKQNYLIRDEGKSPLFLIKAEAYEECIAKVNEIITKNYNKHIFDSNDLNDEEKDAVINFSDDVTYAINNLLKEMVGESGAG